MIKKNWRKLRPQSIQAASPAAVSHRKHRQHYHTMRNRVVPELREDMLSLVEFEEWLEAQDGYCYYCRREMLPSGKADLRDETIDRKDNSRGYALDNIVLCCRRCNLIKGSWFSEQEMVEIANAYLVDKD